MTVTKASAALVCFAAALMLPVLANAQTYPSRPITMVVPFPAGGPSDVVSRIMAEGMSRHLNQQVVIENVGGAGGTIGTARVAAATADGYTILSAGMGSIVAAPALYANLKYDPNTDLEPIGLSSHAPVAIVAKKDFPADDLKSFIAYVKKNAGNVRQAHGGVGAASHMACLLFNTQLGLSPNSVPYKGTGPALNDLVGGHVDYFCEQVVSVASSAKGGSIKAFAVSSAEPIVAMPNVPSARTSGAPEYDMSVWSAILAPKGTPRPIVDVLAAALDKTLDDPEVAKRLAILGGIVPPKAERGPDYLRKLVATDIKRWSPILRDAAAASKGK